MAKEELEAARDLIRMTHHDALYSRAAVAFIRLFRTKDLVKACVIRTSPRKDEDLCRMTPPTVRKEAFVGKGVRPLEALPPRFAETA